MELDIFTNKSGHRFANFLLFEVWVPFASGFSQGNIEAELHYAYRIIKLRTSDSVE